jgi:hypothetical protein
MDLIDRLFGTKKINGVNRAHNNQGRAKRDGEPEQSYL